MTHDVDGCDDEQRMACNGLPPSPNDLDAEATRMFGSGLGESIAECRAMLERSVKAKESVQ